MNKWTPNADGTWTHTTGARLVKRERGWCVEYRGGVTYLPSRKASFNHADAIMARLVQG